MVSESFLDSFSYPDNCQTLDTVSVDSSDSLETSFSACSPDNISRWEKLDIDCEGCARIPSVLTTHLHLNNISREKKKNFIYFLKNIQDSSPEYS